MNVSGRTVTTIPICEAVGSAFCVSSVDASKVYDAITTAVDRGDDVVLSFAGVEQVTLAFLNACVGRLYGVYGDRVREFMREPVDIESWQLHRLVQVAENARKTFVIGARPGVGMQTRG